MFTQQTTCFLGSCFLSFTVFCVFSTTNKCLHQHHCHVMMCHHMLIEITMTKCRGNDEEELRILDYLSLTGVCSRLSVILQDIHTGTYLSYKKTKPWNGYGSASCVAGGKAWIFFENTFELLLVTCFFHRAKVKSFANPVSQAWIMIPGTQASSTWWKRGGVPPTSSHPLPSTGSASLKLPWPPPSKLQTCQSSWRGFKCPV